MLISTEGGAAEGLVRRALSLHSQVLPIFFFAFLAFKFLFKHFVFLQMIPAQLQMSETLIIILDEKCRPPNGCALLRRKSVFSRTYSVVGRC